MNPPDFSTWSLENLANFAKDAYTKIQDQQEEIQELKITIKECIASYRELIKVQNNVRETD